MQPRGTDNQLPLPPSRAGPHALTTESPPAGSVDQRLQMMPSSLGHRDMTPPMGSNNSNLQAEAQSAGRVGLLQLSPSRPDPRAVTRPRGTDNQLPLPPSRAGPHALTLLRVAGNSTHQAGAQDSDEVDHTVQHVQTEANPGVQRQPEKQLAS